MWAGPAGSPAGPGLGYCPWSSGTSFVESAYRCQLCPPHLGQTPDSGTRSGVYPQPGQLTKTFLGMDCEGGTRNRCSSGTSGVRERRDRSRRRDRLVRVVVVLAISICLSGVCPMSVLR